MKVSVLSIEPGNEAGSLDVLMSIGDEQHWFKFISKFDCIAEEKIQLINHDDSFWDTFKFNQSIVFKVTSLVLRKSQGDDLELPADVGDFGTLEEALVLQKPFPKRPENISR